MRLRCWVVLLLFWSRPSSASEGPVSAAELESATATIAQPVPEIIVTGRRVSVVARPDTVVRLTGRQIVERGITNLAQALDQVLDADVRPAGRGGLQVNIRGARKGGVLLILDGLVISDPFNGNFDVTSIPATDIAEIRLSLTPASPLDGPGGNGGVVEVLTRPATGPANVRAQLQTSNAPSGLAAATVRAPIAGDLSARVSGVGGLGMRDFTPPGAEGDAVKEDARSGAAALRLEQSGERGRIVADFGASRRSFLVPPTEEPSLSEVPTYNLRFVDREDVLRGSVFGEASLGDLSLSGRAFSLLIDREESYYTDAARTRATQATADRAHRSGATAQVDYAATADLRLTMVGHLVLEGGRESARDPNAPPPNNVSSDGGLVTVIEPAAGLSYAPFDWLQIDGAGGAAVPMGVPATTWPEAKLSVTVTPVPILQISATVARKGRLPTLRDRFAPLNGNPSLRPEMGSSADGAIVLRPARWLSVNLGGYDRLTSDLIRFQAKGGGRLQNVGDVTVRGLETRAEATPIPALSFGAGYAYADATSTAMPRNPLDFFPTHRAEGWVSLRDSKRLVLFGRVRYTGDRQDGMKTLSPYTTLDGSAAVRVDEFQLTLRVENLLDTGYEARASVPGFGRTVFFTMEGTLR